MKILHYIPKESGIRFFGTMKRDLKEIFKNEISLSDNSYLYKNFYNSKDFLSKLNKRIEFLDISFIIAHGGNDSILKKTKDGYIRDITQDKSIYFQNNFVFAISCYTINSFGKNAVDNGALTYIGFNDSIESFFRIENTNYKKLSIKMESIIKQIYKNCILIEFEKFIKSCYTAKEFYLHLALSIEKEITKLHSMSIAQINSKFETNIPERLTPKVKMIKLEITQKVRVLNEKMKLIGEKNYIPWFYINMQSEENLKKILKKSNEIDEKNQRYKYFMEAIIYSKLRDEENYLQALENEYKESKKMGKASFYSVLFAGEKIASSEDSN